LEPPSSKKSLIFLYLVFFLFLCIFPVFEAETQKIELFLFNSYSESKIGTLTIANNNTLLPVFTEIPKTKKIKVIVTAYSSTPWETDGDPYITASGKWVKEGIVANNLLPFGTKIKIPEVFGDKVFVVEDRMHWTKSPYQVDIWFPSYWDALNFGAKRTYIEILEN
ncbi:3D domain-containing protein, partial [bacterium]|nr:3D domain-containing protein [bacterium]